MRRHRTGIIIALGLIGLAISSSWARQSPQTAPASPMWPTTNWPVSTPAAEGVDGEAIGAMVNDIREGKYGLVDHFLLIRHGRVVADHHFEQEGFTLLN